MSLGPLDAFDTVRVLLGLGTVTLAAWGTFAGARAGLTGWRRAASALAGGLVGLLVIALQVAFKPH
jgi:hypothetical protein